MNGVLILAVSYGAAVACGGAALLAISRVASLRARASRPPVPRARRVSSGGIRGGGTGGYRG